MILTDILREIFQASDSLDLSYGPFLLFLTGFITLISAGFALVNLALNRFFKR